MSEVSDFISWKTCVQWGSAVIVAVWWELGGVSLRSGCGRRGGLVEAEMAYCDGIGGGWLRLRRGSIRMGWGEDA